MVFYRYDLLAGTQSNMERFNLFFSPYFFKYRKKDKRKKIKWQKKQNCSTENALKLYVD